MRLQSIFYILHASLTMNYDINTAYNRINNQSPLVISTYDTLGSHNEKFIYYLGLSPQGNSDHIIMYNSI